jgi:hypothetical protein
MKFNFRIKRRVALLSSCALALQSLVATMPAPARAGSDDDMAAFFYWKVPLGASAKATEPTYGFRLGETYNGWLLPPSGGPGAYSDEVVMPPLVDLSFGGGGDNVLPSLSFSGVDVETLITGRLNQGEDEGVGITTLGWVTLGVMAAGGAVAGCVAAGCFDNDDDDVAAEGGGGEEL